MEDLVGLIRWHNRPMELVVVEEVLVVLKEMVEEPEAVEKDHGLIPVAAVVVLLVIVVMVVQENMLDILTIMDLMDQAAVAAAVALDNLKEDLVHLVGALVF